ncbi:TPA: hypothetical protein ACGO74_002198 [Streptococcus suis]
MARKMSLVQKKSALEKLAQEVAMLEDEEAIKLGRWLIKQKHFYDLETFQEHYLELERVYNFYLDKKKQHESDNNATESTQFSENNFGN